MNKWSLEDVLCRCVRRWDYSQQKSLRWLLSEKVSGMKLLFSLTANMKDSFGAFFFFFLSSLPFIDFLFIYWSVGHTVWHFKPISLLCKVTSLLLSEISEGLLAAVATVAVSGEIHQHLQSHTALAQLCCSFFSHSQLTLWIISNCAPPPVSPVRQICWKERDCFFVIYEVCCIPPNMAKR